jgi:hypothetical protein
VSDTEHCKLRCVLDAVPLLVTMCGRSQGSSGCVRADKPVMCLACGCMCSCRAPSLHAAEHDLDPVRMHTLSPEQFWARFNARYGANKHLVRTVTRLLGSPCC